MTAACGRCQREFLCPKLFQYRQQEEKFPCDRFLLNPLKCTVVPNDADCSYCPVLPDCERQRRYP